MPPGVFHKVSPEFLHRFFQKKKPRIIWDNPCINWNNTGDMSESFDASLKEFLAKVLKGTSVVKSKRNSQKQFLNNLQDKFSFYSDIFFRNCIKNSFWNFWRILKIQYKIWSFIRMSLKNLACMDWFRNPSRGFF